MAFVFNMSIGLGAMVGGQVVDTTSLPMAMWAASGLFLLGMLLVWRTPSRIVGEKRR